MPVHAVDLGPLAGVGPLWGLESEDLNATLLSWPPGHEVAEHVNAERDVLLVVLGGSGAVEVAGETHTVGAGFVVLLPRGARRRIRAGADGVRYLTVHRRRGGLEIGRLAWGEARRPT